MASDYGLNFGFLRSDESVRVSEGRFKTPVGSAIKLGTVVTIDADDAGYLKVADENAAPVAGVTGLLLQELDWDRSIYEADAMMVDSFMKGTAKADRLSIITGGAGTKVWFKNTAGQTRADGRVIAPVTMVDLTGVAVGDTLSWDGDKFVKTGEGDTPFCTVTAKTGSTYVEAVLNG